MSLFGVFGRKNLSEILDPKKRVKIHGIQFTIRKLNPLQYLAGTKALVKLYDIYQRSEAPTEKQIDASFTARMLEHYSDVFIGGVVSVKLNTLDLELSRKIPESGEKKLHVENLLTDWSLAEELYRNIQEFTYGKKKTHLSNFQKKN